MSDTVFTKVDYDLGALVKYTELGEIGLPDIQRPFVWKNAKVRDLFDSMYRGYPVGYLLLWQNGLADDRTIGAELKQKPPRLVIVDGQQRLTSLYAVIMGVPVVRDNYESEKICIAFNPLEERFEVADAAIRRDNAFISDISCVWSSGTNIFTVANHYLDGLRATRAVSDDRRITQFDILKEAQARVLNIQHWHDFMNCIRMAGFRSGKMISSNNNLLFSYMLYLIGRTEYGVEEFTLRKVIAQWFFMSAVTGRFTGSPESAMESDLARLRDATKADQFVSRLQQVCDITLTGDFWGVTLPNDLATSSPRSPSLFAYNAALVLLEARVLFSNAKVSELLDPAIHANRSAIERHHLFPKGYLATLRISGTRETNQIANYAYVEWADNMNISDQAPVDYLPQLRERFSETELAKMYHCHALPAYWEQMEYRDFLEKRRELIAEIIHEGYQTLTAGPEPVTVAEEFDLTTVIDNGESEATEFKSTLRINLHTGEADKRMEQSVLKTLAGFLNTSGGTLIVGVSDDGTPVGIEADKFPNEDKMSLHLVNIIKARMGPQTMTAIRVHFEDYDDSRVLVVRCPRLPAPVFVKEGEIERFYVRTGPSTTELTASQTQAYIEQRFKQ